MCSPTREPPLPRVPGQGAVLGHAQSQVPGCWALQPPSPIHDPLGLPTSWIHPLPEWGLLWEFLFCRRSLLDLGPDRTCAVSKACVREDPAGLSACSPVLVLGSFPFHGWEDRGRGVPVRGQDVLLAAWPWAPGLLLKLPGCAQHFVSLFSCPRPRVFSRWPLGEAPNPTSPPN